MKDMRNKIGKALDKLTIETKLGKVVVTIASIVGIWCMARTAYLLYQAVQAV